MIYQERLYDRGCNEKIRRLKRRLVVDDEYIVMRHATDHTERQLEGLMTPFRAILREVGPFFARFEIFGREGSWMECYQYFDLMKGILRNEKQ